MQISLYAGILALFYIALSVNVIRGRDHHSIALGDDNIDEMKTRIRAHANFAEYAPMFILSRLFHAYGLLVAEPRHRWFKPRITGMVLTFSCLGGLAIILLYQFLF